LITVATNEVHEQCVATAVDEQEAREWVRLNLHDLAAERAELLGTPSDIYWVEINHNTCGGLREKRFKHRSAA
jgi:hypothetical protein